MPNEESYRGYQYHINRYDFASSFTRNKVVLDIACGVGYGSAYLKKNAREVVGGDISEDNLKYAVAHYPSEGLAFVCLDAVNLPFPSGCFDVVVSFETIEHLTEYRKFLCECKRVLKREGVFICSTPNRKRFPFQSADKPLYSFHVREFCVREFYDIIRSEFSDIKLFHQLSTLQAFMIPLAGRLLSNIPIGMQIKQVIKGVMHCDIPYVKQGVAGERIDGRYRVLPFNKRLFSLPSYVAIVVACKE